MSRGHARSPQGERAIGKVPETRGEQTTIVAVLGTNGIQNQDQILGAMNKEKMVSYIEDNLSKNWNEDDVFVFDRLPAHKAKIVIITLKKHNIKYIYLPPYDPTLNPIELFWSILKSILNHIGARTQLELSLAIDEAFRRLRNIDPIPLFKKCGYFLLDFLKKKTEFVDWIEVLNKLTYKLNAS